MLRALSQRHLLRNNTLRTGVLPLQLRRSLSQIASPSVEYTAAQFENLSSQIAQATENARLKLEARGTFERFKELSGLLQSQDLWDDPKRASTISREHAKLERQIKTFDEVSTGSKNILELAMLAIEENSALETPDEGNLQLLSECDKDLRSLSKQAERFAIELLLDGPADSCDCFIEVTAGAGGTESCEFSSMLLNMYQQYALKKSYAASIVDTQPGQEAGIRHGVLRVEGEDVYGWFRSEAGVHRLVRISPYDSQHRRQTCFSQVAVIPIPADEDSDSEVLIPPSELRIDTFRSSGPGGQHANVTDSAVRIVHLPTGIVAQSQSQRSQQQNKAQAMEVLKARILELRLKEKQAEASTFKEGLGEKTWGNQIRSYVLHPYRMVKDHRTGHETPHAEQVLLGDPVYLEPFMEASLVKLL